MANTSIAVLPFLNLSRDAEQEYLSDGITEEIIHALTKVDGLKVTSRRSSFYFKNSDWPLQKIAEDLGVAVILEGSLRLSGDMLRIKAELIQVEDDSQFWSESWDRKLANIFEIQDEIALLIADKLREQFGHMEFSDHLATPQTLNLSAYEHELKARFHFNKWNAQDVRIAIDHWQKALEIDSALTDAHTGLADAFGFLATTQSDDYIKSWQLAVEHTHKALALDAQSAAAWYQMANIEFFTHANFQGAFENVSKAVEYDPHYPEGLQFLSFLYMLYGDLDKARVLLKRALDRDPLNQETLFYHAYLSYREGHLEPAETLLESLVERNAHNLPALITRSYIWLKQGKAAQTLNFLKSEQSASVPEGDRLGLLCLIYGQIDDENYQETFLALEKQAEDPMAFQQHSYLFLAYVQAGRMQEASEVLKKVKSERSAILQLAFSEPLAEEFKYYKDFPAWHQSLYGNLSLRPKQKEKTALLDADTEASYRAKLEQLMEQEEPYLNPQLSLRSLGEALEIHPNHLSWLLNNSYGLNYNQFVNGWRIRVFKRLALDPANAHISLLGLAYESGFNSKTVFNSSFKKETGLSPKAWLAKQKA